MSGKDKERLDKLLYKQDYFPSRSKAKRSIMAGEVYVDGELVDKAGTQVDPEAEFEIKGDNNQYVSRGGLKLEKALAEFNIDPVGLEVMDVGASTGGFTDCLLQKGAQQVYAIDVGYGQLAWKLRQDERVEVFEKTNFRYFTPEDLAVKFPLIVIDVSFISLQLIIPAALKFLAEKGEIVALIKPQFEAGKERVGKKGLVKDKKVHRDVLIELCTFFQNQKLVVKDLSFSPITGASSKNIEFLVYLSNEPVSQKSVSQSIQSLVDETVQMAHTELVER